MLFEENSDSIVYLYIIYHINARLNFRERKGIQSDVRSTVVYQLGVSVGGEGW